MSMSAAVKIIIAMAVAGILIWLGRRWLKHNTLPDRRLRSLPGNMVQELADRLADPASLCAYLQDFFGVSFSGRENPIRDKAAFLELLSDFAVPADELEDLLKVSSAIEPDSLLAYAVCPAGDPKGVPSIITVCRAEEPEQGLLVGVFSPQL